MSTAPRLVGYKAGSAGWVDTGRGRRRFQETNQIYMGRPSLLVGDLMVVVMATTPPYSYYINAPPGWTKIVDYGGGSPAHATKPHLQPEITNKEGALFTKYNPTSTSRNGIYDDGRNIESPGLFAAWKMVGEDEPLTYVFAVEKHRTGHWGYAPDTGFYGDWTAVILGYRGVYGDAPIHIVDSYAGVHDTIAFDESGSLDYGPGFGVMKGQDAMVAGPPPPPFDLTCPGVSTTIPNVTNLYVMAHRSMPSAKSGSVAPVQGQSSNRVYDGNDTPPLDEDFWPSEATGIVRNRHLTDVGRRRRAYTYRGGGVMYSAPGWIAIPPKSSIAIAVATEAIGDIGAVDERAYRITTNRHAVWTGATIGIAPGPTLGVAALSGSATASIDGTVHPLGRATLKSYARVTEIRPTAKIVGGAHVGAGASETIKIQMTGGFAQDTYLDSGNPTTVYGTSDTLSLGDNGTDQHNIVIELPVRAVTPGATLSEVKLTFSTTTSPATASIGTCERMLRYDWDQITATWNTFVKDAGWTSPGGDVGVVPVGFTFTIPDSGDIEITGAGIQAMVQDAVDNRGGKLLLRLTGDGDIIKLASGQNGDANKAPTLTVTMSTVSLAYKYPGMKRAMAAWVANKTTGGVVRYMAMGRGVDPSLNWSRRRRLKAEIYRVPILGTTLDSATVGQIWASFGTGEGAGPVTELGLFTHDSTIPVEACNTEVGWSSAGYIAKLVNDHVAGDYAVEMKSVGASTADIVKSYTSINPYGFTLTTYPDVRTAALADRLHFWVKCDYINLVNQLDLVITDTEGTWTWTGLETSLAANGWVQYELSFADATTTSTVAGPADIKSIAFNTDVSGTVAFTFDNFRILPNEEDILAWWQPPPISNIVKGVDDIIKMSVEVGTKRGTN